MRFLTMMCVHVRTCVHPVERNRARTAEPDGYIFHLSWSNAPVALAGSRGTAPGCTHMYACTHITQKVSKANKPRRNSHVLDEIGLKCMAAVEPHKPEHWWPHYPHCSKCHRRLHTGDDSNPVVGPNADRRCPHCSHRIDIDASKETNA